jgi:hypothetical protein
MQLAQSLTAPQTTRCLLKDEFILVLCQWISAVTILGQNLVVYCSLFARTISVV